MILSHSSLFFFIIRKNCYHVFYCHLYGKSWIGVGGMQQVTLSVCESLFFTVVLLEWNVAYFSVMKQDGCYTQAGCSDT